MNDHKTVRPGIVFCRNIHWDDVIRISTHSMANEFAKHGWHCGWISRAMTPWRMTYGEFRKARRIWWKGGYQHPGIFEYSPLFMLAYGSAPILRSKLVWKITPLLALPKIQAVMARAGLGSPEVCWIGSLSMGAIGAHLEAKKVVYQAHDAFSLYPDTPPTVREIEAEMIRRATVVVTTSESTRQLLQELYPDYADRIYTLTHGVHMEHYEREPSEPDDLRLIPRPRAVLVGTLDLQDDELLIYAARSLPEVSFVCIGPGGGGLARRALEEKISNVYLLGPRYQTDLPLYLAYCDLGLIAYPFEMRDSRRFGTNPMKRYEYAAAGLPTVSVNLREYALTPSPIYTADSPQEFVEKIGQALHEGQAQREQLIEFARVNSWTQKYLRVLEILGMVEDATHTI